MSGGPTAKQTQERSPYPHPSSTEATRKMRANRRRDTKPELALRSLLHRRGLRFRVDKQIDLADGARARPDIVFAKAKLAVYVDGCFWHGCPAHATQPKANAGYWGPKLAANIERDRRTTGALEASGWTVLRFWEHEPPERACETVAAALEGADPRPADRARRPESGLG